MGVAAAVLGGRVQNLGSPSSAPYCWWTECAPELTQPENGRSLGNSEALLYFPVLITLDLLLSHLRGGGNSDNPLVRSPWPFQP